MKPIIILCGPVGAGKSTVAKELIAMLPGPVSYIEGDKFWDFIPKDSTGKNKAKNFKTIMMAMTAAAMPLAMADYDVILDFSIPPWFLDTVKRMLKVKNIPFDYVVLLPSEAVCAKRAVTRTEGKISDYKLYSELYACFVEAEQYSIDDEVSSPTDLAAIIHEGLKARMFRVVG